jgi:putative ABC transport system substrate-binding protein
LIESQADFIFEAARQKGWPTMFSEASWVAQGGLAGYGPNYYQMGRQAARLIDKILKGAKPKDLPVEKAGKFDLVINLRTANAIGLSIPPEILKKADRVIR